MKLDEKTIEKKYIYKGRIINVRTDTAELPNGKQALREVVEHPGGVTVAALTDNDELMFVRQFRYPYSEVLLELPAGKLEYGEDPCHSIYVKFRVTDDMGKLSAMGAELDKTYFVIWTTTTWTLPANVAICVGPNYEYSLLKANGEYYVMATDLAPQAMADAGITDYETVGIIRGSELEYMKTAHPFIDRTSLVIVGDHVTLESGTGCVHTAPGHGVDDFIVCKKYKEIPIVVPVD